MSIRREIRPDSPDEAAAINDEAEVALTVILHANQHLLDPPAFRVHFDDVAVRPVDVRRQIYPTVPVPRSLAPRVSPVLGTKEARRLLKPDGKTDFGVVDVHESNITIALKLVNYQLSSISMTDSWWMSLSQVHRHVQYADSISLFVH